ncbi:MAG: murein L,D-transpeptidase catalytic domain family protein [Bacteroidota bacterium]|nr:murein L,D-transpeptidase catalytic domain family protein [Bacteroidota bacterium]
MQLSRLLLLIALSFTGLSWFSQNKVWKKEKKLQGSTIKTDNTLPVISMKKLEQKASAANLFVRKKGFNDQFCFLLDMGLPSGQNRFFIYDFKKDTLQMAGLVAHGNCFEYWLEGRRYSNVVGSGCTSLGKYKIGNSYTGKFGYSYKLHGLDSSNSNAFERTVVLHSHRCIPEAEVTDEICQSNGCPTVSPNLLVQLKKIIDNSKKPVLLWAYN